MLLPIESLDDVTNDWQYQTTSINPSDSSLDPVRVYFKDDNVLLVLCDNLGFVSDYTQIPLDDYECINDGFLNQIGVYQELRLCLG